MSKDIICPHCQQPTSVDASFCGNCGRQLNGPTTAASTQSTNLPAGTPDNQPNQTTAAPTTPPPAAPTQAPTTSALGSTTNPPNQPITTTKDTFFKLPRLARPISIIIIIIFSLLTLLFAQSIFRTEEIYGDDQPTEGETMEQYIDSMRIYGIVFTSVSAAMVAFGVVCYKHPRLKK